MIDIDRIYPDGLLSVNGSYVELLEARDALLSSQARYEESLANRVRREVAWLRRGAQGAHVEIQGPHRRGAPEHLRAGGEPGARGLRGDRARAQRLGSQDQAPLALPRAEQALRRQNGPRGPRTAPDTGPAARRGRPDRLGQVDPPADDRRRARARLRFDPQGGRSRKSSTSIRIAADSIRARPSSAPWRPKATAWSTAVSRCTSSPGPSASSSARRSSSSPSRSCRAESAPASCSHG